MISTIVFQPLIPWWLLIIAAFLAAILMLMAAALRAPGALWRTAVFILLLLAFANPALRQEDREPVSDYLVAVVDRSPSQEAGKRQAATDNAAKTLSALVGREDGLELRVVETAGRDGSSSDGTELFRDLDAAISDIPQDQLAGLVVISDGQIHDVPPTERINPQGVPIHTFLTGRKNQKDRKLTVVQAPVFGIVGQNVSVIIKIEDLGARPDAAANRTADLTFRLDGGREVVRPVNVGRDVTVSVPILHGGTNVLELEIEDGPQELTRLNNRAVIAVNGVRDRLRVLLVSGEPHAGQRTWRNLLKADPSVDLVHFTILRPPTKRSYVRPDELALIEFPTQELFDIKLFEFDLVIFDRYRLRGVLPPAYLGNVARFVEQGGGLLTAAGPAFASDDSLYRSPLAALFPARPTGSVVEKPYVPAVTDLGRRHPVTAQLPGLARTPDDDPAWGPWLRLIDAEQLSGQTLMSGASQKPLLILDRFGQGRVAQLMSDHAWLWTRGFEGGGPQRELLRRLAHWLMKEPELEEEHLSAAAAGSAIEITRRTMADSVPPATVTTPSGEEVEVTLEEARPGVWRARMATDELGLFRVRNGDLTAVTGVGPLNPREYSDLRATGEKMEPVARATGGGLYWIADNAEGTAELPTLRRVRRGRQTSGNGWMGVYDNNRYVVRATSDMPLLPPLVLLLAVIGCLGLAWRFEGR